MANIEASLAEVPLRPEDAHAVVPLSIEAGWNQTVEDWAFMLQHGHGVGMRDARGAWIASALTLPLGSSLSWISMVLVTRAHRRDGIGTRLLKRCIDVAAHRGAVGLDATELGRPVYQKLGFRDLYPISRWRLESAPAHPRDAVANLRVADVRDLSAVAAFDHARSGMERAPVLQYLRDLAPSQAWLAEAQRRPTGYALGRAGRMARQIGPIIADDEAVAVALLMDAVGAGAPALMDVPDAQCGLTRWLEQNGAIRERSFMRMVLGEPPSALADTSAVFAIAGPELG